jgi:ribosomal subunit interface protein
MTIDVRCRPFELTPALAGHVQRRLRFALGRFAARVAAVRVRLTDDNGPRGGVDKACRVRAHLRGAGLVRVDEIDADLYAAIDRAAARLSRGVARALDRRDEPRARLHGPAAADFTLRHDDAPRAPRAARHRARRAPTAGGPGAARTHAS